MKIYQVDSFTKVPFAGNPAAVCILDRDMPDSWMQSLAAEMNLSETAFVRPAPGEDPYSLRWFTPATEVSICGHATLATAHILWSAGIHDRDSQIRFTTKSGELTASRTGGLIEMVFPLRETEPVSEYPELSSALGVKPVSTHRYSGFDEGLYLLELATPDEVTAVSPDFSKLLATDAGAVIVTSAFSIGGFDFVSRFFAPAFGIDEDPVTGSAHCYLAPFWASRLGKKKLTALQASARSGVVYCAPEGDRVILGGNAVTVFEAELSQEQPLSTK